MFNALTMLFFIFLIPETVKPQQAKSSAAIAVDKNKTAVTTKTKRTHDAKYVSLTTDERTNDATNENDTHDHEPKPLSSTSNVQLDDVSDIFSPTHPTDTIY